MDVCRCYTDLMAPHMSLNDEFLWYEPSRQSLMYRTMTMPISVPSALFSAPCGEVSKVVLGTPGGRWETLGLLFLLAAVHVFGAELSMVHNSIKNEQSIPI